MFVFYLRVIVSATYWIRSEEGRGIGGGLGWIGGGGGKRMDVRYWKWRLMIEDGREK